MDVVDLNVVPDEHIYDSVDVMFTIHVQIGIAALYKYTHTRKKRKYNKASR